MSSYNSSAILELITTKDQADNFIVQLENLINSMYDTKIDINQKLGETLSPDKKERIIVSCQENKIPLDNPELMQKFVTYIKETIKDLPVAEIQMAQELNEHDMANLSNWFLLNLKRKVLIKASVNQTLIGGVVIGFNGLYKDYSVKKKLEEKINNGELLTSLRAE